MAKGAPVDVKVGILSNPHYPETGQLGARIHDVLCGRGIESLCSTAEREEASASFPANLDMLITLGGDGTMLRAAHLRAADGTPILGIHMGRLGFLAEVRRQDWRASAESLRSLLPASPLRLIRLLRVGWPAWFRGSFRQVDGPPLRS